MFEFDAGKLIIIGIVALIVIGPKELPRVMRQIGQAVAKLRRLGAEFQAQFMEAMRDADAEDLKTSARELAQSAKVDLGINPLALAKAQLTSALERPVSTSGREAAQTAMVPLDTSTTPAAPETAVPASPAVPRA
jgi:sec-independent protein translocase protein TatB